MKLNKHKRESSGMGRVGVIGITDKASLRKFPEPNIKYSKR